MSTPTTHRDRTLRWRQSKVNEDEEGDASLLEHGVVKGELATLSSSMFSAPKGPPVNVQARPLSSTSLSVAWQASSKTVVVVVVVVVL